MFQWIASTFRSLFRGNGPSLPKVTYPDPRSWTQATPRQVQRVVRVFAQLEKRNVPVFPGPLFVEDDECVRLQSPGDVARRVMALWGVNLRAEGFPQSKAQDVIQGLDLWDYLTPGEKEFLKSSDRDPDECRERVWKLEAIWVLLWGLGYVKQLEWPSGMCNVEHLVATVIPRESDRTFFTEARLRPVAEILDMQELTLRQHWAIRNAIVHHDGRIPEQLDWTDGSTLVSVACCAPCFVVENRHHALNWLLNTFDPPDWDCVETHT